MTFLSRKFAIVKYDVFCGENLETRPRASIEGYLVVAASTPTYSSLLEIYLALFFCCALSNWENQLVVVVSLLSQLSWVVIGTISSNWENQLVIVVIKVVSDLFGLFAIQVERVLKLNWTAHELRYYSTETGCLFIRFIFKRLLVSIKTGCSSSNWENNSKYFSTLQRERKLKSSKTIKTSFLGFHLIG